MNTGIMSVRDPAFQRMLEQAIEDLRSTWRRGERVVVETLLERHPTLRADHQAMLDLIYEEYELRRELGEDADPAEYLTRFPELGALLMLQFGVDAAIGADIDNFERTRPMRKRTSDSARGDFWLRRDLRSRPRWNGGRLQSARSSSGPHRSNQDDRRREAGFAGTACSVSGRGPGHCPASAPKHHRGSCDRRA